MNVSLLNVLTFTLLPVAAIILGGIVAAFRQPGAYLRSSVQHFAAGIVFAAVALELLPDIMHERSPVAAVIGFTVGIGLMLGIKELTARFGERTEGAAATTGERATGEAAATEAKNTIESPASVKTSFTGNVARPSSLAAQPTPLNKQPTSLLITLAVDILIDGLLIGVGFAAGAKQGVLLTIALTIEVLFLGLSAAVALTQAGAARAKVIGISGALALLLAAGAAVGAAILTKLSGVWLEGVLSFGAAALLYLVTEELLVEAHEEPETPLLTAMFFVGFVVLLVIEMLAGA